MLACSVVKAEAKAPPAAAKKAVPPPAAAKRVVPSRAKDEDEEEEEEQGGFLSGLFGTKCVADTQRCFAVLGSGQTGAVQLSDSLMCHARSAPSAGLACDARAIRNGHQMRNCCPCYTLSPCRKVKAAAPAPPAPAVGSKRPAPAPARPAPPPKRTAVSSRSVSVEDDDEEEEAPKGFLASLFGSPKK